MERIDAYLDEIVSRLDCDPLRRDEVRLEVHSHIRELVDEERRMGRPEDEAVTHALRRFGAVEDVAARLQAANVGRPAPEPGFRTAAPLVAWTAVAVLAVAGLLQWSYGIASYGSYALRQAEVLARDGDDRLVSQVYPGVGVSLLLAVFIAFLTHRYIARRQWVWAGALYTLSWWAPDVFARLLSDGRARTLGWPIYMLDQRHLLFLVGLIAVLAFTIRLPRLIAALRGWGRALPWPATATALIVLALWAQPSPIVAWDRTAELLRPLIPNTDVGAVVVVIWQLSRLGAFVVALWCAAQTARHIATRRPVLSVPVLAGALAAAAGVLASLFALKVWGSRLPVPAPSFGYAALLGLGAVVLTAALGHVGPREGTRTVRDSETAAAM